MPTLTRRQQSNDFAIFRRQTTLMAVLVLQVATSFSPASVLNKQYTQGGVVVHVAELGENLPYTTPVHTPCHPFAVPHSVSDRLLRAGVARIVPRQSWTPTHSLYIATG